MAQLETAGPGQTAIATVSQYHQFRHRITKELSLAKLLNHTDLPGNAQAAQLFCTITCTTLAPYQTIPPKHHLNAAHAYRHCQPHLNLSPPPAAFVPAPLSPSSAAVVNSLSPPPGLTPTLETPNTNTHMPVARNHTASFNLTER